MMELIFVSAIIFAIAGAMFAFADPKKKTTREKSGSFPVWIVVLAILIIVGGFIAFSHSGKQSFSRMVSFRPSTTIILNDSDSRIIKVADSWKLVNVPKNSSFRLKVDSGIFQLQFVGHPQIFEKDSNDQWRDENGPIQKLPRSITGPNFRIRSSTADTISIEISVWPK